MDKTLIRMEEWAIAIHDAILVLPGTRARELYVQVCEELRVVRNIVLNKYRFSIGATSAVADIAWAKLMATTEQLCSAVPFRISALK